MEAAYMYAQPAPPTCFGSNDEERRHFLGRCQAIATQKEGTLLHGLFSLNGTYPFTVQCYWYRRRFYERNLVWDEYDRNWLRSFRDFLSQHADSARIRDKDGRLPLHVVCAEGRVYDFWLDMLIAVYPEGAGVADNDGKLPLDYVLERKLLFHPRSVGIFSLLDAFPGYATRPDPSSGLLPLHRGFQLAWSWRIIERFAQHSPESVGTFSSDGWLPIHHASVNRGKHTLKIVGDAYPEAYGIRTKKEGYLPIHIACRTTHGHVRRAKFLVDVTSAAGHLHILDFDGRTPLVTALEFGAKISVVLRLISKAKDTVQIPDRKGNLPLHVALRHGREPSFGRFDTCWQDRNHCVVSRLIKCFPKALEIPDCDDELPLHYIFRHDVQRIHRTHILQVAFKHCPAVLEQRDSDGMTPLLLAAACPSSTLDEILSIILFDPSQIASLCQCIES